jgi:hypothetical protein
MLTLPQIYQRTNARRKESAKYVKIIYQKRGWDSHGRGYVACASYSTKEWNAWKQKYVKNPRIKNRYVTVIVFLDPQLHVAVSCSCADFKYRWEVALNHKQAAEIEYSNGELPKIRNPSMKGWMCKHLLKLFETIKPELPKAKRTKAEPIHAPQVQIPPSVLKQQEAKRKAAEQRRLAKEAAEREAARQAEMQRLRIKPNQPKVKSPAKPSRKQSTLPRSVIEKQKQSQPAKIKPNQQKVKAPSPLPPAMMTAPKAAPKVTTRGPAMMRAPK